MKTLELKLKKDVLIVEIPRLADSNLSIENVNI